MSSELQDQILTSPEGQRIIRFNTTGFYLESLIGLWLYQVIGLELDDLEKVVDSIKLQRFPETTTWGISWWEDAYRIPVDESLPLEVRRRRLKTKGRKGGPINPARIEQIIEDATGYKANVIEHVAPYTFQVNVKTGELPLLDPDYVYRLLLSRKQSHKSVHISYRIEEKPGTIGIGAHSKIGANVGVYPFQPKTVGVSGGFCVGGFVKYGGTVGVMPWRR